MFGKKESKEVSKSSKEVSKRGVGRDLTKGPIMATLLIFAGPMILTNVIQQCYSMVDLAIVGQFVGSTGTVGVSTGGEVADIAMPIATGFASAGQIYIAQLVGSKMTEKTQKAEGTLITLMLLMSVVAMLITMIGSAPILHLINCPEEAFTEARAYMLITAIGIPFTFGYNAVCGILRGLGESRRPLTFIIIAAVINIILDLVLVVGFRMGAAGTAIATMVSQFASFFAAFYFMLHHKEQFRFELKWSSFRMDREALRIILRQGIPQAIRSTLVRFSMLWINAHINAYGLTASATNSVGNKIQKFLDLMTTGVTQAAGAMVGQNLGAKQPERARKTVWYALYFSLGWASIVAVLSVLIPGPIFGLFTNDPEVIELGIVFMHIMIAHYFCSAVTSSFQSMIIGSGFASMNFAIGILDGVVCKIGLSLLFVNVFGMGLLGYFWATGFSRALPGLICFIYFISNRWQKRKLLTEPEPESAESQ